MLSYFLWIAGAIGIWTQSISSSFCDLQGNKPLPLPQLLKQEGPNSLKGGDMSSIWE